MKLRMFDNSGAKLLREYDAAPVCGEDFCDRCGDCLACYSFDGCCENEWGDHCWVKYEPKERQGDQ
jgi:hypothetical protein